MRNMTNLQVELEDVIKCEDISYENKLKLSNKQVYDLRFQNDFDSTNHSSRASFDEMDSENFHLMKGNREMFDLAKNQFFPINVADLKVEPEYVELKEIKSEFKLEAVDIIENSQYIPEENIERFDYEKKVLASCESNNVYEDTVENWSFKIESEEIQIKSENEDENSQNAYQEKFDGTCNRFLWRPTDQQNYICEKTFSRNGCLRCEICKNTFPQSADLKTHLLVHTEEKEHKCEICKKSFSESGHLQTHLLTHTGQKKFKCEICKKAFLQSSHLKNHLLIHTGEKNHKCEICNKSFSEKGNLKKHLLVHTGEKKYKCEICKKAFVRSSHLKYHLLVHTGEKTHKCEICQKIFSQSGHLKTHLLTHTGEKKFKCEICKKAFLQSSHLKNHLLIHTGEKKHKCEICKKFFSESGSLKKHLLIHTRKTRYQCEHSQRKFTNDNDLKTNFLNHKKEKKIKCANHSSRASFEEIDSENFHVMKGNREMLPKNQYVERNVADLKVEPLYVELKETKLEENSDQSEAVAIGNSKYIKQENLEIFDLEKKVFVSCGSYNFYEDTDGNHMEILRNLTD